MANENPKGRGAPFARIAAAAGELGKVGDRASDALKTLEADLFDAGAAARASIQLRGEDIDEWAVGWGKLRGEWGLVAQQMEGEPMRLLHAPLRVRLEALRRADDIAEVVAAKMEEIVSKYR